MEVPQQCLQLVLRGIEPVSSFGSIFGSHISRSVLSGQYNFSHSQSEVKVKLASANSSALCDRYLYLKPEKFFTVVVSP